MKVCRCKDVNHSNHEGKHCDKPATENDGYCKECHNKAADEFFDANPESTDLPPRE